MEAKHVPNSKKQKRKMKKTQVDKLASKFESITTTPKDKPETISKKKFVPAQNDHSKRKQEAAMTVTSEKSVTTQVKKVEGNRKKKQKNKKKKGPKFLCQEQNKEISQAEVLCLKAIGRAVNRRDKHNDESERQQQLLGLLKNGYTAFTTWSCDQILPPSVNSWITWNWHTAAEEKISRRLSTCSMKITPCASPTSPRCLNRDWGHGEHAEITEAVFVGRKGSRRGFEQGYDFLPPLPAEGTKLKRTKVCKWAL
ncbi:unnamed protein product [Orchesella dallaii]|uniref:Uncharacterized protein n=1 Tax=Orchesella dallaii TaxID=48710 RepID=A0ABP1Q1E5_9HEXA